MKHANLSIFIPHEGCPHLCSFCNQRVISGQNAAPTPQQVAALLQEQVPKLKDPRNTEIAFFGGSFTAIKEEYMTSLLEAAFVFIRRYSLKGVRVSTRPDCINARKLEILRRFGVTAIELGAQSMVDEVLYQNGRGHTAQHTRQAAQNIRAQGFELGLQMMTGLYADSPQNALFTAQELIKLKPQTVRIYPCLTLKGTHLAALYEKGEYIPQTLKEAIELCCALLQMFYEADIPVIKLGLHASEMVENDLLAGPYHPAFRELCEGRLYLKNAQKALDEAHTPKGAPTTLLVGRGCTSKMVGQRKINVETLTKIGYNIKVKEQGDLPLFAVQVAPKQ